MPVLLRNTHLEINLDQFHKNIEEILKIGNEIVPILKSNAYGHGLLVITEELEKYPQIKLIGVATLNEAVKIKKITSKRILIIDYLEDNRLIYAAENGFIPTIWTFHQATLLQNKVDVFINVDTGFHRAGEYPSDIYMKELNNIQKLNDVNILGIFTHLRLINLDFDQYQYNEFIKFVNSLPFKIKYISVSDSISLTRHTSFNQNLIRVGALLFGLTAKSETDKIDVKPIQTLKSKVTRIKLLKANLGLGYSEKKYETDKLIATIGVGYSDGIPRLTNDTLITINGTLCPILGINGMDQIVVDVTNVSVLLGDDVILFGKDGLSLEEFSTLLKTNKNDVISRISSRVPRLYIKNTKPYKLVDEMAGIIDEY